MCVLDFILVLVKIIISKRKKVNSKKKGGALLWGKNCGNYGESAKRRKQLCDDRRLYSGGRSKGSYGNQI